MASLNILVVEDERGVRELLAMTLEGAGHRVTAVSDAHKASEQLAQSPPDLLLLDWMLPGMSGLELARRLRRDPALARLPVIMLTARDEEDAKVQGLESGVDDYITKPFSTRELLARINAVMRRTTDIDDTDGVLRLDCGLMLDEPRHRVSANGREIHLGPTEFRLLHFLMRRAGRVLSRAQLLDGAWGEHACLEERTVDVHIRRLRKALAPAGLDGVVQTVRGVGYRLAEKD